MGNMSSEERDRADRTRAAIKAALMEKLPKGGPDRRGNGREAIERLRAQKELAAMRRAATTGR